MTAPKDLHLAALREEYSMGGLDERDALPDPLAMLRRWLHDAVAAGLRDPTAMVLSTVDPDGAPSSRMVLCKGLDHEGLVFFTGYGSAKAKALQHEPRVAVLFPWHPLQRQVRVGGTVTPVPAEESDAYFASRPRGSQLSAAASPQSEPVESRAALDRLLAQVTDRFADREVERPPTWGGYRITPTSYEFWQGRTARLHDRLRYDPDPAGGWRITRLAP